MHTGTGESYNNFCRVGEAAFSLDGKGLIASRDAGPGDTLVHLPEVANPIFFKIDFND